MKASIEQRITALEASIEQIKKMGGVPGEQGERGARGPAGDISAAVANAKAAVSDAEARVQARADATYAKFAAEVKALREEVKALREFLDERIHSEVDARTISVLRDYHLLDENNVPTNHANVTHPENFL